MKTGRWLLALAVGHGAILNATAASVADYAVQVSATVQTNPPLITLSWPADPAATSYTLFRKTRDSTSWGDGVALGSNATAWMDTDVSVGSTYEYRISKTASGYAGVGYCYSGIEAPMLDSRGKVILVVESGSAAGLAAELARLQQDLVGDGWTVLRHDVSRSDSVTNIKALITADYSADPSNTKALFVLGHVPVPYSGNFAPDGHPDHQGAWPADVYYGDLDGAWTDSFVNTTSASDPRNWNVPGDGKFNQIYVPSDVELQVGRVDMANLPAFSMNETELLRRYLNKDHGFRHKLFTAERRGLIADELGFLDGEVPAVNGWRNFAPFFGPANTISGNWLTTLSTQSYLWSYGCGAGSYTSCSGVATTAELATSDPRVVFTMSFGSYFGDWDSQDNFLRAALATTNYTLTSAWVARPHWHFHHMALGETIGFSTLLSQNNNGDLYSYNANLRSVHIALMGDPTLRMHIVAPPTNLVAVANGGGGVELSWDVSPDTVLGYHVYRATNAAGPFTRLNGTLITGTTYIDATASSTATNYMVRAVKLEVSGSGSYYNASQGISQAYDNTLPLARPDTIWREGTNSVTVSVATLLSNDTDADGNAVTFSGASASSANGGTVTVSNGWVFYEPLSGSTNADSFTYTVTDSHGASATGVVTVAIRVDTDLAPSLTVSSLGNNSYLIQGDGIPGKTYRIQYAEDVGHANWTFLGFAPPDDFGVFLFTDNSGSAQRFYRSVYP